MATTNHPPYLYMESREVNKKVDYSKWERCDRKKPAEQKNIETIVWTSGSGANGASYVDHQSPGRDQSPPSAVTSRRRQKDISGGKSQPNTADGNTFTSTPNSSLKKTNTEQKTDPAFIKRNDGNRKTLMLLLKSKKKAIKDLESLCALIQERNQLIAGEIRYTDKRSFQSAEEFLDRHEKLETSISAFYDWSQHQIVEAENELKEAEEETKKSLSALQKELSIIHVKLANARTELHTLKTYKDREYPVKVLMITSRKREIEKLEETQQDEYEDLKQLFQNEMVKQAQQNLERQQKLLAATVKENVSRVPRVIRLMATDNVAMKKEIEIYKKEIENLEEKNNKLIHCVQELNFSRKSIKEEIFEDVFLKLDKCTPDMDVVLNIPKEEWLPI